jgi:hypothetical protein
MQLGEVVRIAAGSNYVIPRYNEFVQHHRDVEAERDALVTIMTRPPRVRTGTFSASGSGRCLRERQLAWLGMPKLPVEERTANIFANGDYVHLRHQVAGMIMGYVTAAEVSVSVPEFNLTGTMDGMLDSGDGLELKSIYSRGFNEISSYGPKTEHLQQTSGYMLAANLDAFHVVYENKDTNVLKEFRVLRSVSEETKVIADLLTLNEATDEHRLLPMLPECVMEKGQFPRCPYRKICPLAEFASPQRRIRLTSSTPST